MSELLPLLHHDDIVILHDPQTAGLIRALKRFGPNYGGAVPFRPDENRVGRAYRYPVRNPPARRALVIA